MYFRTCNRCKGNQADDAKAKNAIDMKTPRDRKNELCLSSHFQVYEAKETISLVYFSFQYFVRVSFSQRIFINVKCKLLYIYKKCYSIYSYRTFLQVVFHFLLVFFYLIWFVLVSFFVCEFLFYSWNWFCAVCCARAQKDWCGRKSFFCVWFWRCDINIRMQKIEEDKSD